MNPPQKMQQQAILLDIRKKSQGPIIDRIDMWVDVPKIDYELLSAKDKKEESSGEIIKRVIKKLETNKKKG